MTFVNNRPTPRYIYLTTSMLRGKFIRSPRKNTNLFIVTIFQERCPNLFESSYLLVSLHSSSTKMNNCSGYISKDITPNFTENSLDKWVIKTKIWFRAFAFPDDIELCSKTIHAKKLAKPQTAKPYRIGTKLWLCILWTNSFRSH